jgi:hypothetical protein
MFKGRGGVLLFIIIIILVIAAFLFLRSGGGLPSLFGRQTQSTTIPVDLQALVPPGWTVLSEPQLECDFDGDGLREWLIFYTYNSTTLPVPLQKSGTTATFAPIGGVIFDTQPDTLKPKPDSPGPYRASNIVPYKLLPDYYAGKGQGYLGETSITALYSPGVKEGEGCSTTEVNVYGYSGGPMPTRVSVFRWAGIDAGYQVAHFAGDARVESTMTAAGQVNAATTYNRLQNHRSILCDVQGYVRPDLTILTFIPNAAIQTIDFCFGPPNDPVYPEGVVVAVLRAAPPPTTAGLTSYFLNDAVIAPELQFLTKTNHDAVNMVTLGNPSSVTPVPVRGEPCTADQISGADTSQFWCGRERVRVETRIMLNGVPRDAVWILTSVIPQLPNAQLYWRVQQVELQ